jgi:glycerol kinase
MSGFILALDQGTTSSRAILFDRAGAVAGIAQREFKQHYPQPGWVEHDPLEIWDTQLEVMRRVCAQAQVSAADIAAIGITNQRETTVVWDRATGEPLYNAIVWQDRRTAGFIDKLKKRGKARWFQRKTGLVLDAYFSGSKLVWILDKVKGARKRAQRGELAFGTIDSWLVWKLTGGRAHITDVSNASRTLLFNIHKQEWDTEILRWLRIPESLLPEVKSSSEIYAQTAADLLGSAVPIAGIAGDQQAATFGQVCFESGQAKNTYGTGCFMMLNTGRQAIASRNRLLTTIGWRQGGQLAYALEGSVFIGGAVVQWLRDGLGIIKSSSEIEALARSVPDNGGVYLVPAFTGLGAPHWDQYARGAILGLTRGSSAAHIARAALESIVLQVADIMQAMSRDSGIRLRELRVDGGASNNDLLMQMQADVLGVPVVRPQVTETTALGAAYLAGLAIGFWPDRQTIARQWKVDKRFEPQMGKKQRVELLKNWHKAVERAKEWAERK